MKTETETAKEIASKFTNILDAIEAINLIIESEPTQPNNIDWSTSTGTHKHEHEAKKEEALEYWLEVRNQLEQKCFIK